MKGELELYQFCQNPELYSQQILPSSFPRKLDTNKARAVPGNLLELKGYCPVSFYYGSGYIIFPFSFLSYHFSYKCYRYERFAEGKPELVIEYKDRFYSLASEEKLNEFVRNPEKFANQVLPKKLPPPSVSPSGSCRNYIYLIYF